MISIDCSLYGYIRLKHFADDVFKYIFWMKIHEFRVKFHWSLFLIVQLTSINIPINIPALVRIMAWRWPGDKPLFEPTMVKLPTHICVTRPQWVNKEQNGRHLPRHFASIPYNSKNDKSIAVFLWRNIHSQWSSLWHLIITLCWWLLSRQPHPPLWGRTGGSGPPTGVNPPTPAQFFLPTPAPFFPYFFRVPPPKIEIFCQRPRPSDHRPRPFPPPPLPPPL